MTYLEAELTGLLVEFRKEKWPRAWCVVGSAFGTVIETFETEAEAELYVQAAELAARGGSRT